MGIFRQEADLPETAIHDILRNDRRRRVIKYLQERGHEVPLRTLAERLAELETGESPPPTNVRNSVYVSLHQTHLPKLDDRGIVEYDEDRKLISLEDPARQVDLYMEVVTRYGITWSSYYRGLATIALLFVLSSELGYLPLFTTTLWTSLFLFLIAGSTLYQLWNRRWLYLRQLL
jgi:hypothetical protein